MYVEISFILSFFVLISNFVYYILNYALKKDDFQLNKQYKSYFLKIRENLFLLMVNIHIDILILIGNILLNMPIYILIINWFHLIIDSLIIFTVLYYKYAIVEKHMFLIKTLYISIYLITIYIICFILNMYSYQSLSFGNILYWFVTFLYITTRIPPIYLCFYTTCNDIQLCNSCNICNKQTISDETKSIYVIIFGNISLLIIILIKPNFLVNNIQYVISLSLTLILDSFIIYLMNKV